MKKLVVLLTLVATVSAYSQGTVSFQTRLTTPAIDAPITYADGGPALAGTRPNGTLTGAFQGSTAYAALYGGATANDLTLLIPAVGFRSGTASGYVLVGSASSRDVPGTVVGGSGYFQIRAWDTGVAGSTWESLTPAVPHYEGQSAVIRVANLGGGSPPAPAAPLINADTGVGIAGFQMTYVPEPSIIGLGLLGALAGLMVFRRRN
jgi:hypothetical protein